MKFHHSLAVSGLALSAFLVAAPAFAQGHVDANGMPTDHSTPAEHAATENLNGQVSSANAQADAQANRNNAQYQASQQQYQNQLQQNQAAQQQYQDQKSSYDHQTAAYMSLRARYAAERAAYHRGVWPDRYIHWTLDGDNSHLVGRRVQVINGDLVGTVTDVARTPRGRVEGLLVSLDNEKMVWIDREDIRYDRADGIVMTDLDHMDLRHMADERV